MYKLILIFMLWSAGLGSIPSYTEKTIDVVATGLTQGDSVVFAVDLSDSVESIGTILSSNSNVAVYSKRAGALLNKYCNRHLLDNYRLFQGSGC